MSGLTLKMSVLEKSLSYKESQSSDKNTKKHLYM